MNDLTENEKIILGIMFRNLKNLIEKTNDLEIGDEWFSENDLFYLACKLGIEDYM